MESPETSVPAALAPEQWQDRDYRPRAADVDAWATQTADRQATDDATQYVAKLGLTAAGDGVIIMSRAHETVLVPPPARHALAALALYEQPYGFTRADRDDLRRAAEWVAQSAGEDRATSASARAALAVLRRVGARVSALLPTDG
jgi:hypothetical protein